MSPRSQVGRRILLNRLYGEYAYDLAFVALRGKVVKGEGSTEPLVAFVGEAPGKQEARHGRPFIGPSGALLNEMMGAVNLDRGKVFITNVVKLHPVDNDGNNRTPSQKEIVASRRYLWQEMALLGWPPMVLLGKTARQAVNYSGKIGEWGWCDGTFAPVLALHHPAYGIYQQAHRPAMFRQFKAVMHPPVRESV